MSASYELLAGGSVEGHVRYPRGFHLRTRVAAILHTWVRSGAGSGHSPRGPQSACQGRLRCAVRYYAALAPPLKHHKQFGLLGSICAVVRPKV